MPITVIGPLLSSEYYTIKKEKKKRSFSGLTWEKNKKGLPQKKTDVKTRSSAGDSDFEGHRLTLHLRAFLIGKAPKVQG